MATTDSPATKHSGGAATTLAVQHVSLMVDDAEAATDFYTSVLGFEILVRPDFGFPGAWLGTGNGIQIHLVEQRGFVPPPGPHIAFETDDLDAETERLRAAGVEVGEPSSMPEFRQAFFSDPSGNQLELNEPTRP